MNKQIAFYKIPLSAVPQSFEISLAGKLYQLTVRFVEALEGSWIFDISLPSESCPIVHGIVLVTGVDLLEPYKYLGFNGGLLLETEDGETPPNKHNLDEARLLFFTKTDDEK